MTSSSKVEIVDRAAALALLPKRGENAHKWGVGGVVVIGGAPGYIGAPALAAMGAARSGAGIVSLAIPRSSIGATAALVPEAVFLPLPETDSSHGVQRALEAHCAAGREIQSNGCRSRALARRNCLRVAQRALWRCHTLGSPLPWVLGRSRRETESQAGSSVVGGSTPAVVDADALHWLSERESWWDKVAPWSLVLTPHVGELASPEHPPRRSDTGRPRRRRPGRGARLESDGRAESRKGVCKRRPSRSHGRNLQLPRLPPPAQATCSLVRLEHFSRRG